MEDKQVGQLRDELADLIRETIDESTPDISSTLGKRPGEILFEFVALLLWIATNKTQTVLPKKQMSIIDTISDAFFLVFEENANFSKIFNEKTWHDFIRNRFGIYYEARDAFRTQWGMVLEDEEVNEELSIFNVAQNFIVLCLTKDDKWDTDLAKAGSKLSEVISPEEMSDKTGKVMGHCRQFSERAKSILSRFSPQLPKLTQDNIEDRLIDFVATELKKDINYLVGLGIKLDKGKLGVKTGGVAWAGYKAFTGDWLSALVIGGVSLLVGGLTNGYKRIKLMEMKQKWLDRFSELNQEQLDYLAAGLQRKYPLLLGQFQNLLQTGQG